MKTANENDSTFKFYILALIVICYAGYADYESQVNSNNDYSIYDGFSVAALLGFGLLSLYFWSVVIDNSKSSKLANSIKGIFIIVPSLTALLLIANNLTTYFAERMPNAILIHNLATSGENPIFDSKSKLGSIRNIDMTITDDDDADYDVNVVVQEENIGRIYFIDGTYANFKNCKFDSDGCIDKNGKRWYFPYF